MDAYAHDIVQVVVYRWAPTLQYLVLKRSGEDGGWWQPITGHIEPGESEMETLRREIMEEIGVADLKYVSDQIYDYEYDTTEGRGRDRVYMVEIAAEQGVRLSHEHVRHKWADLEGALALLKYPGNKESYRRADMLLAEAR